MVNAFRPYRYKVKARITTGHYSLLGTLARALMGGAGLGGLPRHVSVGSHGWRWALWATKAFGNSLGRGNFYRCKGYYLRRYERLLPGLYKHYSSRYLTIRRGKTTTI